MNIDPNCIETEGGHWWNSFGRSEREVSAKLFVRACQKANSWTVTQDQLDKEDSTGNYWFNGLIQDKWITDNKDDTYTANHRFQCHVYGMFPRSVPSK